MNDTIAKIEFQQDGYFYEMVTTYTTAISGLLLYHPHFRSSLDIINKKKGGKLVGLGARVYPALEVKPHEIIELIRKGEIDLGRVADNLSFMLLNIAYESVKPLLDKQNPKHEFFRHLRHGASHGGKWTFIGNEPSRPAEWRDRTIEKKLQGEKLWNLNLGPGDILVLLWDIEQDLCFSKPVKN